MKKSENVLLIGCDLKSSTVSSVDITYSINELKELVKTAGGTVKKSVIQVRKNIDPKFYIGKGKLEEIKFECELHKIDLIVFDDEITPSQQRNIENFFEIRVIDRTALILDIFALHAVSKVAKLQIELAQLYYQLPRLKNMWSHFSKQGGGLIGNRGPGETQLETDKRTIRKRISGLKIKLKYYEKQNSVQRKSRTIVPNIALIGYTNAGKSSLINKITKADTLVQDKLFATLDPTSRQCFLPNNKKIILTDTVGFIKKLPHQLIEAFKTTLEVTKYADLLIHVVDFSSPDYENNITAVYNVLDELNIKNIPVITFFNKIDKPHNILKLHKAKNYYPNSVVGSVKTNKNLNLLFDKISELLNKDKLEFTMNIPIEKSNLLNQLFEKLFIKKTEYLENSIIIKGSSSLNILNYFKEKFNFNFSVETF